MAKLEIKGLVYKTGVLYNFDLKVQPKHWYVSDHDRQLIAWLETNVGPVDSDRYRLPQHGKGWLLVAGHEDDDDPFDYHYRGFPDSKYVPKGRYGIWLHLEDSDAVLLKLSGIL